MDTYCWFFGCFAYFYLFLEVVLMSILIYFATIFWSLFPNLIHVFQGGEDYINKVNATNLVINGDFSNGGMGWSSTANTATEIITFTDKATLYSQNGAYVAITKSNVLTVEMKYYVSLNTTFRNGVLAFDGFPSNIVFSSETFNSFISTAQNTFFGVKRGTPVLTDFDIDNITAYNVSTMINNGVKSDNGILFSDLTNEEIRLQLDQWITDHGSLDFTITKDNTLDSWFNTGFVEKTAERDFLDYLGYFFWLSAPPIFLFLTLDLIRRII